MERYQQFLSIPGTQIIIGNDDGRGHEKGDTRHWLNVQAHVADGYQATDEKVSVCIGLTVPQVAEIVKIFFFDICLEGGWCGKFLHRLLVKRWAIMSSNLTKCRDFDEVQYEAMRYAEDVPGLK